MRTMRAKVCEQGGKILRAEDGGTCTEGRWPIISISDCILPNCCKSVSGAHRSVIMKSTSMTNHCPSVCVPTTISPSLGAPCAMREGLIDRGIEQRAIVSKAAVVQGGYARASNQQIRIFTGS